MPLISPSCSGARSDAQYPAVNNQASYESEWYFREANIQGWGDSSNVSPAWDASVVWGTPNGSPSSTMPSITTPVGGNAIEVNTWHRIQIFSMGKSSPVEMDSLVRQRQQYGVLGWRVGKSRNDAHALNSAFKRQKSLYIYLKGSEAAREEFSRWKRDFPQNRVTSSVVVEDPPILNNVNFFVDPDYVSAVYSIPMSPDLRHRVLELGTFPNNSAFCAFSGSDNHGANGTGTSDFERLCRRLDHDVDLLHQHLLATQHAGMEESLTGTSAGSVMDEVTIPVHQLHDLIPAVVFHLGDHTAAKFIRMVAIINTLSRRLAVSSFSTPCFDRSSDYTRILSFISYEWSARHPDSVLLAKDKGDTGEVTAPMIEYIKKPTHNRPPVIVLHLKLEGDAGGWGPWSTEAWAKHLERMECARSAVRDVEGLSQAQVKTRLEKAFKQPQVQVQAAIEQTKS